MSKEHTAFQRYTQEENWMKIPRVIKYMPRNLKEFMIEKRKDLLTVSPGILVLELNIGIDPKSIYVVNLYNAPEDFARARKVITAIVGVDNLTQ